MWLIILDMAVRFALFMFIIMNNGYHFKEFEKGYPINGACKD
jgi:hypothetical protein